MGKWLDGSYVALLSQLFNFAIVAGESSHMQYIINECICDPATYLGTLRYGLSVHVLKIHILKSWTPKVMVLVGECPCGT